MVGVWWVPHGCGWGICLPPATRQMSCFLRSIRSAFYNCTAVESDSMHHNILPLKCLQYSAVSILWSNIYPIHFHTSAIWYKSNRYNTYNSEASGWDQLERISWNQQHGFTNKVLRPNHSSQQSKRVKVFRIVIGISAKFLQYIIQNIYFVDNSFLVLTTVSKDSADKLLQYKGMFGFEELSKSGEFNEHFLTSDCFRFQP